MRLGWLIPVYGIFAMIVGYGLAFYKRTEAI